MNRKKQIKPLKPNQFDKEKMQSGKQRNKINTDDVILGFYRSALCKDFLPKY